VLDVALHLFASYGYFVIIAGVLLENAAIPAPGHTVVLAGAFLAYSGHLSIVWVAVCACAAAIVGDNIGYLLGKRYGQSLIARHRGFFRFTEKRECKVRRFFDEHGPKAVVIGRFVTGLQTVAAIMAGISHMRWRTFFAWNVIGAIMWAAAFSALGYAAGRSVDAVDTYLGVAGLVVLGVVIVGGAGFLLWRHHRRAAAEPV
jgi:membrane protein DedA with SNARE-associated domain